MANSGSWGQSNIEIKFLFEVFRHHRSTNEHLGSAFRVTNIGQLILASLTKNVINKGWEIFSSHFFEGEIPIYRLVNWI